MKVSPHTNLSNLYNKIGFNQYSERLFLIAKIVVVFLFDELGIE